jgi:hypothetical protein
MRKAVGFAIVLASLLAAGTAGAQALQSGGVKAGGTDADKADEGQGPPKKWEVGAAAQTHRLLRQEDLNNLGAVGRNKNLLYYYVYGSYDFTPKDSVTIQYGLYQRFLADGGETGFRSDDVVGTYARSFDLPAKINMNLSGSLSIPTSWYAQRASIITEPRLGASFDRAFGDLNIGFRTYFTYTIARYKTLDNGASANNKFSWSQWLDFEYTMPFHRNLSAGVMFFNGYVWLYDVGHDVNTPNQQYYGAVADASIDQPMQQSYGGHIYGRYSLPALAGVKTSVTLGLGQGSPVMGYTSINHDGVRQVYGFWRQTSQVWLGLAARY